MRAPMRSLGVLVAVGVLLAVASVAHAASINVGPSSAMAGGMVTVSGDVLAPGGQPGCAVPGTVLLFSGAFGDLNTPIQASAGADAKYSVQTQIPAGVAPGPYPVTARCGGGNLGVQATIVVLGSQLPATGSGGLLPPGVPTPWTATFGVLALGLLAIALRMLRWTLD
jgi:hypothetical protein